MSIRSENQSREPKDRIIFALDTNSPKEALDYISILHRHVGGFKVGLELLMNMLVGMIVTAPSAAHANMNRIWNIFTALEGTRWFLDGKFHDIPNTVGGASQAVSQLKPWMFNLHASAGPKAISKAVENSNGAIVAGVTVLTSHSPEECASIFGDNPADKVLYFTHMLRDAGAGAIICSPAEGSAIRSKSTFDNMLLVTPGCRPVWASTDDQARTMTPAEGIRAGIDYFVVGRPIRKPPPEIGTPIDAAKHIADEIGSVM